MTITKASELFSKDGRFFPVEPAEEGLNHTVFAPLPAEEIKDEGYAALVEPEGHLGEWWITVGRRQRAGSTP